MAFLKAEPMNKFFNKNLYTKYEIIVEYTNQ